MAKSIGRVGILRDGTRVTVRQVERVLDKNPKRIVTSWLTVSGSGANVYRLADGRVILADYVRLTDKTVEFSRKKAVEPEPDCIDTETEPEEISELSVPTFSSVALGESEVPTLEPGEEESDREEEVEETMPSKTYDKLKDEDQLDRELKGAIARGASEKEQNAIIDAFTETKPAPEGIAL